ncbi:hypothetical protein RDI58_026910 [Solanum bulbocastanum]|uniref:Uncharacterized protein n=1 Tax=Solanum bulbocastanum TaxID=147425 RepID=A0AAN8SXS7_SOLBU
MRSSNAEHFEAPSKGSHFSVGRPNILLRWERELSGLFEVTKTVDDTNPTAPRRSTSVTVPPLGADLVREVEQVEAAHAEEACIPATTTYAQAPPSTATIQAACSSKATHSLGTTLVPQARVQMYET